MTAVRDASWESQRVLVTGGGGFVGSHLVEALVARGACVTVVDCLEQPWRLHAVLPNITYCNADLADGPFTASMEPRFTHMFHLAAFSMLSAAEEQPDTAYRQNVIGTVKLLQLARRCPLKKFVFSSAGGLYTNVPKYLPIDERHPIDPA